MPAIERNERTREVPVIFLSSLRRRQEQGSRLRGGRQRFPDEAVRGAGDLGASPIAAQSQRRVGNGDSAALFMAVAVTVLRTLARQIAEPDEILSRPITTAEESEHRRDEQTPSDGFLDGESQIGGKPRLDDVADSPGGSGRRDDVVLVVNGEKDQRRRRTSVTKARRDLETGHPGIEMSSTMTSGCSAAAASSAAGPSFAEPTIWRSRVSAHAAARASIASLSSTRRTRAAQTMWCLTAY